jgi:hypothetical protein
MLSACERPRGIASRVKGQAAIVKSLRSLLIRTHRYANLRARRRGDVLWAARVHAALTVTLEVATGEPNEGTRDAHRRPQ